MLASSWREHFRQFPIQEERTFQIARAIKSLHLVVDHCQQDGPRLALFDRQTAARKGAKDEKITKSYGYRTFYNPTPIMRH